MELVGFDYERCSGKKLPANGYPISEELLSKGYVQKNNAYGEPCWYVKRNRVWITLEFRNRRRKYDIYTNIMSIYPERKQMSLKLAQEVIRGIISKQIIITFEDEKPFLIRKPPKNIARRTNSGAKQTAKRTGSSAKQTGKAHNRSTQSKP